MIDDKTIKEAIIFLHGREQKAADILKMCTLENCEIVDYWMNGSEKLDGLSIVLRGPRPAYDILSDRTHQLTQEVFKALTAVLPDLYYIKDLRIRAIGLSDEQRVPNETPISTTELKELIQKIEEQKKLMIAVATGGPKINDVNAQYQRRRLEIKTQLKKCGLEDPNQYNDLWAWYGRWSDSSLPTYQSRRIYINNLYQQLLEALITRSETLSPVQPLEPTGWTRVDRNVDKINNALSIAKNEEDFQTVGLLCREAIISLAQAVYDPDKHGTLDGITPSNTDAKRMLESYIAYVLEGGSCETHRKFAKSTVQLTVDVQHRRSASFREAALCAEATRSLINTIAIISGQRDPEKD